MLNQVNLIGNLTRDVEMRYLPSGDGIASFGIATSRRWKDKQGQKQEEAEFHNITAFGGLAKICGDYLKKGSKAYIQGRIKTEKWEKDGQQHSRVVIIAEDMKMLDSRNAENAQHTEQKQPNNATQALVAPDYDDDIPF
jgi:single-strand DNA-binding protein